MTDFGDKNIEEFRRAVLRLYLLIAAPAAVLLTPVYFMLGIHAMTVTNLIYTIVMVTLCLGFLNNRVSFPLSARIFIWSTVASMMMGSYVGNDVVDNRFWLLIVPLGTFTVFGVRDGRLAVAMVLVAAVLIMAFSPSAYSYESIAVFAMAYIVMAAATYAFCRYNEINIRTIAKLSHTDSLTGLYNRQFFEELSSNVFNRSLRAKESMAVYMVDIDWFKKYNDQYGHILGDQALAQVADVIKNCARRGTDLTFRYGGEEFCVISSSISLSDAELLGNNMLVAVRQLKIPHAQSPLGVMTVSVGLCHCDELEGESAQSLLNYADSALYAAKAGGRDTLHTNSGKGEPNPRGVTQPA